MKEETVYKIRAFNRAYMPIFDLLGNQYLGSTYSVAEARILFELHENDGCNAAFLAKKLNIDKGYVSRILKHHEKNHYIVRSRSATDSRAYDLHLTPAGNALAEQFIEKSNAQIRGIVADFSAADCQKLTEALDTVIGILSK